MRRHLALLTIALVSLAAAACADVTAPRRDGPTAPTDTTTLICSTNGSQICK
jgi:hypothetical protein